MNAGVHGSAQDRSHYLGDVLWTCPNEFFTEYLTEDGFERECALGDNIYKGPGDILTSYQQTVIDKMEGEEKAATEAFNMGQYSARVIVENTIGRVEGDWGMVNAKTRFTHAPESYKPIYTVACGLTNRLMRVGDAEYPGGVF